MEGRLNKRRRRGECSSAAAEVARQRPEDDLSALEQCKYQLTALRAETPG